MSGPPKTPNVVRFLTGKRGAVPPEVSGELDGPGVSKESLAPPDGLNDRQTAIWREIIENAPLGLLRKVDSNLLRAFVVASEMNERATRELEQGLTIKTTNGNIIQNPAVGIVNRTALIIARLSGELGLSSTSRARIRFGENGGKGKTNRFTRHTKAPNSAR